MNAKLGHYRRLHMIDFHIRDDKAEFGVLLIVFINHELGQVF